MAEATALYAAITVAAGLVLLAPQLLASDRLRSAGAIDVCLGVGLLLYGAFAGIRGLGYYEDFYLAFLGYFLLGTFLLRRYYLFVPRVRRRTRDALVAGLLGIPGCAAMLGLLAGGGRAMYGFLSAVLTTVIAASLLVYFTVLALREEPVHKRDILGVVFVFSQVLVLLMMILASFEPPP